MFTVMVYLSVWRKKVYQYPAWVKINVMAKKIFVSTDLCRCSGTDAQFAQLHGRYVIFHYEMAVLKRKKA